MNNDRAIGLGTCRRIFQLVLLFAFLPPALFGQEPESSLTDTIQRFRDTTAVAADTLVRTELSESGRQKKEKKVSPDDGEHSPTRAVIYSAILPGLGQAYNRKYFKIPIVYGALGGAGYLIYFNNNGYREAIVRYDDDPSATNERLLRAWRRNLELSIIGIVAVHGLQIIDAYVDANLFYWDVDPDLSLRISPGLQPMQLPLQNAYSYGITCSFRFK